MNKVCLSLIAIAAPIISVALAAPAHATRTWASGVTT